MPVSEGDGGDARVRTQRAAYGRVRKAWGTPRARLSCLLPPACPASLRTHARVYKPALAVWSALHQAWWGPPSIPVQCAGQAGRVPCALTEGCNTRRLGWSTTEFCLVPSHSRTRGAMSGRGRDTGLGSTHQERSPSSVHVRPQADTSLALFPSLSNADSQDAPG